MSSVIDDKKDPANLKAAASKTDDAKDKEDKSSSDAPAQPEFNPKPSGQGPSGSGFTMDDIWAIKKTAEGEQEEKKATDDKTESPEPENAVKKPVEMDSALQLSDSSPSPAQSMSNSSAMSALPQGGASGGVGVGAAVAASPELAAAAPLVMGS